MAQLFLRFLASTLALVFLSTAVLAQSPEAPADDREEAETRYDANLDQAARRVFLSARQAFAAGDYEVALERFQQAYQLSPRPTLLYNIAATLDRLRRDEEAVAALKRYLEAAPDAPDRVEIEARIRVLEEAIARREAQAATETETDTDTDTDTDTETETIDDPGTEDTDTDTGISTAPPMIEEPRDDGGLHPAIAISAGAVTLAMAGLLIWSGLDTLNQNDDFEAYVESDGATFAEGEAMLQDVESAEKRTNILMGLTIGVGAAAVALAIFTDWGGSDSDEPEDGSISIGGAFGPDGGMLGVGGRF